MSISDIRNKRILIIGGTGSLGNRLTERYIYNNEVFIYSRGENNQWLMKNKFNNDKLHFYVGDIRDSERLKTCLFRCKPNIIIIAAALKHIDICEYNINECINTNIDGIRNVIDIITDCAMIGNIPFLDTVLFVSTDKACAPVNTYGMCKAVSERVMVEKTNFLDKPKFVIVRYGNVLMSRGSILPKFHEIGTDITKEHFMVTDKQMTRFFMTLQDSAELIDYAIEYGESGDTVIPRMIRGYRIYDIAQEFSKLYNKPIKITGIRPGEKLHESLISFTESLRAVNYDCYFIIKPSYKEVKSTVRFQNGDFNSNDYLSGIDGPLKGAIYNKTV